MHADVVTARARRWCKQHRPGNISSRWYDCHCSEIASAISEARAEAEALAHGACPSCRGTDPKCGGVAHDVATILAARE